METKSEKEYIGIKDAHTPESLGRTPETSTSL